MKNYQGMIEKALSHLGRRHSFKNVFSDFLQLVICAYHPTNTAPVRIFSDTENETIYEKIIAKYAPSEHQIFVEMMGSLIIAVSNEPYYDHLGDIFMEYMGSRYAGQFFTPHGVCNLMAGLVGEIASDTDTPPFVNDCAVGSGRNLLAAAAINNQCLFTGNDIDLVCAKMSVVNLLLNGLSGFIGWGDTLRMEFWRGWKINIGYIGVEQLSGDDTKSLFTNEK